MNQIKVFTKMELCNLYGLNVLFHTKDSVDKKKRIALGIIIIILFIMLGAYCGGMSYGLIKLGMGETVPAYFLLLSTLLTLMLSVFKAGGIIFKRKCYDIITSLPMKSHAIVAARFIRLYVENIIITAIIMLPSLGVYLVTEGQDVLGIIFGLFGILFVPCVPIAIASAIGAIITGISSRMNNKAMVEIILTLLLIIGVFALSFIFSENPESISQEKIKELLQEVSPMTEKIYPPAAWYGAGVVHGIIGKLILYTTLSVMSIVAVAVLVSVNYREICQNLFGTSAKHNYEMEHLQGKTIMQAMVQREKKRYFSSGVYVTNTIIGPVMGILFCIGLFFVDFDKLLGQIPIDINVNATIAFLLAGIFCINHPVATSISMEGKEWWIIKSLPVDSKNIIDSKIIFNIGLILPFAIAGDVLAVFALKPTLPELVYMFVVPIEMIIFTSVFCVAANLKFPKLQWDEEVSVVKQSASAMIGGMGSLLVVLICGIPVLLVPAKFVGLTVAFVCTVIGCITYVLYKKSINEDLKEI